MTETKDGVVRLGAAFIAFGAVGSLCGAIVLYSLDFHLTLRGWVEQLLAAPEVLAMVRQVVMGLFVAAGGTVLLATGVGILAGHRMQGVERDRVRTPASGEARLSEMGG